MHALGEGTHHIFYPFVWMLAGPAKVTWHASYDGVQVGGGEKVPRLSKLPRHNGIHRTNKWRPQPVRRRTFFITPFNPSNQTKLFCNYKTRMYDTHSTQWWMEAKRLGYSWGDWGVQRIFNYNKAQLILLSLCIDYIALHEIYDWTRNSSESMFISLSSAASQFYLIRQNFFLTISNFYVKFCGPQEKSFQFTTT